MLESQNCVHQVTLLSLEERAQLLLEVPGWELQGENLIREYRFKDYYQTMAFVNAVAWIAHQQDHHPDMQLGYNRVKITYNTHSVGGISINDFICAARVNLLQQ
jgi:4a-hydroxytetrahydrobiopterin dehydratase